MNILQEAISLVDKKRQSEYGSPIDNWTNISVVASSLIGKPLSAEECLKVVIAMKLCRETHKHKRDNLVDCAGYLEILNQFYEKNSTD